jgi:hypothetical protein
MASRTYKHGRTILRDDGTRKPVGKLTTANLAGQKATDLQDISNSNTRKVDNTGTQQQNDVRNRHPVSSDVPGQQ